ncbi:MAG: hypothetical protein GXO32_07505, partial [Crenarchaeota archaeon]|nr:hypothetical protein [Thermoproteota archaeon]
AFLANDWIVAGNHDWSYTRYADREFWYEYTVPDLYYRDVGEWRFVLLNGYALNQGLLREFVEVLNQSCAQHRYVVLVWHDPITYSHYDYPTDFSYWQMQSLRKVVREFRSCIKLMIFGHLHVFRVGTYDGIPYIITGGGGAPLSSPKYGLPIYHFVILELYPNGSFSYVPISIDDTSISVERIVPRPGVIEYEISNGATSINGTRVQLPMRVESFVRGIHLEVFLVAPPGYSRVVIDSNSRWINVSCSARRWFVYVWGLGALEPRNGVVSIGIPTGSVARARLGAVNGSIAIEGCSRCSAIATFRLEALGKSFRVSLEPTRVSRGLLEVDPSYVLNASAARIEVGSRVLAAVSNGAETKVLRAPLPLARPSIELRYLPSYVGKELSFELCLANASRIYILIDNSLAYSLRGFEGCRRVSLDISRYGEGPHLLKIVAISRSGARSVAVKPFVACWTPPSIEVPSVVRVSSLNQRIEIVARGVAPYTVVVKCLNTSVAKVFSSRGGESRFAVSPIELGIVSSGSYEIRIDVYDQVGHSVTKLVKLVVGTHRAATRVSTTRVSSSVPRASVLTASSTRATVSTSSTAMRTTSSAARWSGVGCWVWVAVAVACAAAALAALARRRS